MTPKQFLIRVFTWWNGVTFGTQFWTWRFGEFVGEDEYGIDITGPRAGGSILCLDSSGAG